MRTSLSALTLLLAAGPVLAQTGSGHSAAVMPTGIVSGKVYDRQSGEALAGGMVVIEDTSLGNVTNDDGSYFVGDVPAGSYRIRAEYLGYESLSHAVRVNGGQTATVDFAMGSEVVRADAIVAVVEKEPIPIQPPAKGYSVSTEVQTHVPEKLEEQSCRISTTVHGSYIIDGRWELSASVGALLCGDQVIECKPVVVDRRPQPQPPVATMAEAEAGEAAPASP